MRGIFIALFSICMFLSAAAFAHRPYVVKIGTLESPMGNPLILEKLFGDGIFSADPVSLQIRNMDGAVIAYAPTGNHVGVFCPSIKFCLAFPHSSLSPFSAPWQLDYKNLDYDKKLAPIATEEDLEYATGYKDYLTNKKAKQFHSYEFDDPFLRKGSSGFVKAPFALAFFSPIFIFADHIVPLTVLAFICSLPFLIKALHNKLAIGKEGSLKVVLKIFAFLFYLGWLGLFLTSLLITGFTLAVPMPYIILVIAASLWTGNKYIRFKKSVP